MAKKTKIVLVEPPLSDAKQGGRIADIANIIPSLGIGYIAAVLRDDNFPIKILDPRPHNMKEQELIDAVIAEKPDILGFTATIMSVSSANKLAKELRRYLPDTIFVLGGPHITSLPEETMKNSCFDIGVIGEGEHTMLELAQAVEKGKKEFDKINGLIIRKGERFIYTEPRMYINDLDNLPYPARDLYPPLKDYRPVPASYVKLPLAHVMTSRGCPNQCIFCDRKIFGERFRARTAKNVVDEIEECTNKYGAREIKFFDDTFTMNPARVEEICHEMKRRGIKVPWSCLTRVNTVTEELLQLMKDTGCWQVAFGLESGNQDMLNRMKKGITVEQSRKAVTWAKKVGLNVRAFFVLGMPGETKETIKQTVEFAKNLDIDIVNFYIITLYPGNELYDIAKKEGKILHYNWDEYNLTLNDDGRLSYVPEGMTEDEFKKMISWAHRSYYLRPAYIIKQIANIRSWQDIAKYWKAFRAIVNI